MGLWAIKGPASGVWNLPFCLVSQGSAAYHKDRGFLCNRGSNNDRVVWGIITGSIAFDGRVTCHHDSKIYETRNCQVSHITIWEIYVT